MIAPKVAWRFLTSSKFQTILIVMGIAVGVSVQVFVGTLIQSLQKDLVESTVGNSSQVTVAPAKGYSSISGWQQMEAAMRGNADIAAVSVSADGPGLISYGGLDDTVTVRGVVFADAEGIYGLGDSLETGALPSADYQVVVSAALAEDLGIIVGNSVTINTTGTSNICFVVGLFDLGAAQTNKWVFATLATSQEMFGLGGNVTRIESQVSDVFKADAVADEVRAAIDDDKVTVTDWKAENEQLLTALSSQGSSSYMIQAFVLVSVVIGIASVLAITVVQKSRQIGILKAMGLRDRDASMVFLFQGLGLGLAGAALGAVAGIALLISFLTFATNPDGTPVINLYIDYGFVALSAMIAIISSIVAALIPARKSARLDPIEVIRNG
jgi:lipoprotein-releasing system permease protein